MTKSTNKIVFPIVLKSIIDLAVREKTLSETNADPKKIRAKIRANERAISATSHVKNTSHIAHNQTQLDALRCAFDPVYADRLANARKSRRTSRKTPDAVTPETNDA